MSTENRDRPAFPTNARMHSEAQGISKREYFAAMAMQGLIASDKQASANINTAAEYAIKFADELLKQLGE